jgi:hypothetical protein
MAIDFKVSISINDKVLHKYWDQGLQDELEMISQSGWSEEVYCGVWVVYFDDYDKAIEAERELFELVDRYIRLNTKEMTIAEIEEKLGHPIKIIK